MAREILSGKNLSSDPAFANLQWKMAQSDDGRTPADFALTSGLFSKEEAAMTKEGGMEAQGSSKDPPDSPASVPSVITCSSNSIKMEEDMMSHKRM